MVPSDQVDPGSTPMSSGRVVSALLGLGWFAWMVAGVCAGGVAWGVVWLVGGAAMLADDSATSIGVGFPIYVGILVGGGVVGLAVGYAMRPESRP